MMSWMPVPRIRALAAAALAGLAACDGGPSGPRTPWAVEVVSGSGQSGPSGVPLPQPVVFQLRDINGRPVAGHTVHFSIVSGESDADPDQAVTDRQGRVQTRWTLLGAHLGTHQLAAYVSLGTDREPLQDTAYATAVAGPVAGVQGFGYVTGPVAQTFELRPRVVDAHGNGIPGVTVTWQVVKGGGHTDMPSTVSGPDGVAPVRWTFGTVNHQDQELEAHVAGVAPTRGLGRTAGTGPFTGLRIRGDTLRMDHPDTVTVGAYHSDQYGNQTCFNRCGGAAFTTTDPAVAQVVNSSPSSPLAEVVSRGAGTTFLIVSGAGRPDSAVIVVRP